VLLAEGMLFVELVNVKDDWLWRNDRIGNISEVGFGCFGKLVIEEAKDRMENIVDGAEPIVWCG
jgi:hypothetical protein